jgi:NitT/TauT family transport system substrate-binding protein
MHLIKKFALASMALFLAFALVLSGCSKKQESNSAPKPKFTVAVSIYAGWMPWYHAKESGILKQWADRYGVEIDVQYMSYPASLDAFVAGKVDAVVMTNMEALDMPAAAGVETSVIIVGDYSNGNDAVLVRNGLTLNDLKGKQVYLVEKTVSQYLLARALSTQTKLSENDLTLVNVSDEDIEAQFLANRSQQVVVTWNPMVINIAQAPGVTKVFDSSQIPGEIQDLMVVNTRVLNSNPDFARALVGAWYHVLGLMTKGGPETEAALQSMANLSAAPNVDNFKAQLSTTRMFWTPQEAVAFTRSKEIQAKNDLVRNFCFEHNLLGENAKSADVVGISYPDGTIQGDPNNVKLHYDARFMEEAAAGKITLKK